jgi:hypothetical protein
MQSHFTCHTQYNAYKSHSTPHSLPSSFLPPSYSTLTERESLELEDLEAIEITENSSEEDKLNALLFPPPKMEQGEGIGDGNGLM